MSITHLEPQNIWKNFAALNAVPRPSKRKKELSLLLKIFSWFTHFCRRSWKRHHQKPATAEWKTVKPWFYNLT